MASVGEEDGEDDEEGTAQMGSPKTCSVGGGEGDGCRGADGRCRKK